MNDEPVVAPGTVEACKPGIPGWPRWATWLVSMVQGLLLGLGFAVMFGGASALVDTWSSIPILPAIPFVVLGWMAVVAAHEAGHFVGARLVGMTPYCMGVAWVFAWRSSAGWRVRLSRMGKGFSGFVASHFDPDRSFRSQAIAMLVAGPLANVVAAAALAALAVLMWPGEVAAYLGSIAVFSLCAGIANLLPQRNRVLDNDGLQILHWLRGYDEDLPELVWQKLNGLSLKGVMAEALPVADVARLRDVPQVGGMLEAWFRIKAAQNQEKWLDAAQIGAEADRAVETLDASVAAAYAELVRQLRVETAFSKAMAERTVDAPIDRDIDDRLDWLLPALRARCKALEAALQGDARATATFLEESARRMSKTCDIAYRKSEERMRLAIARVASDP